MRQKGVHCEIGDDGFSVYLRGRESADVIGQDNKG